MNIANSTSYPELGTHVNMGAPGERKQLKTKTLVVKKG